MNELIKHIENECLFAYTLSDGGAGIVVANSEEEAKEKVKAAYIKHGGYENENMDGVDINIFQMYQRPFADVPDVLEIFE